MSLAARHKLFVPTPGAGSPSKGMAEAMATPLAPKEEVQSAPKPQTPNEYAFSDVSGIALGLVALALVYYVIAK